MTIISVRMEKGESMSRPKTERNAEVIRLREEGKTLREIARIMGISNQRVSYIYLREIDKAWRNK